MIRPLGINNGDRAIRRGYRRALCRFRFTRSPAMDLYGIAPQFLDERRLTYPARYIGSDPADEDIIPIGIRVVGSIKVTYSERHRACIRENQVSCGFLMSVQISWRQWQVSKKCTSAPIGLSRLKRFRLQEAGRMGHCCPKLRSVGLAALRRNVCCLEIWDTALTSLA